MSRKREVRETKIRTEAADIFREYDEAVAYNNSIGLYDTVRRNERFFIGNQWEGLDAPGLDKPVLNFLKRVCSYINAMLVSDDIAVDVSPFDETKRAGECADILQNEIQKVLEDSKAKQMLREMARNAIVDGDGCFYWYYDTDAPDSPRGKIALELLENTRILFANPYVAQVQRQPYIIIARRENVYNLLEKAKKYGAKNAQITPDGGGGLYGEDGYTAGNMTTVLIKMFFKNGTVHFTEVTKDTVIRPVTDTGYTLYPISYMNYERVRNSYHGQAVITGLIPNQVAVNKLWAMAIYHQHTMAFPKVFYDRMKIKKWTNRVGEAIGVAGNPSDVVATAFRAPDMSAQLVEIVDKTIAYTKEFMGASDTALGNVAPDNTSAIIAVQKATAAPLELQRLSMYQFVEDSVRIIAQLICAHYGVRSVVSEQNGETVQRLFDFSCIPLRDLALRVEVGPSAYWSELQQIGTLDNLFAKGIITDALLYLDSVPDGYIRNKGKIIEKLRENVREGVKEQNDMRQVQK